MKKITQTRRRTIPFKSLLVLLLVTTFSYSQVLEVRGNNIVIANGDTTPSPTDFTDFGSVPSGNKFSRTFVLKNTGSSSLVFPSTAVVKSTGGTSGQFSITSNVVINNPTSGGFTGTLTANTYTFIEISFNPTTTGLKSATITINLTTGSPKPYTFTISGTGTTAVASNFTRTTLAPTFNYPYALIYGPDDYLWLTERVGKKISRVSKNGLTNDLLINLGTDVYQSGGQDGMMGLALHPNLGKGTGEDFVYVAYTYSTTAGKTGWTYPSSPTDPQKIINAADDATRRTKIVRYSYTVTSNNGVLDSPLVLIDGLSGSNDHNSGKLAIGLDNKLYYTIGDQGVNQFANTCNVSHAQDIPTQTMLDAKNYNYYEGKILRMNLDGTIPTDNPVIKGVKSHIFTYGHRNAQGLVFGINGKLYSSEHGPKSDDEINILKSGGNYGWPYISGYKDDKNYEYCNWSTISGCDPNNFSDYVCGPGATSLTESSWTETFTNPITTLFTIDAGYNFTGGWLTWPTIGPSSAKIYQGFDSQVPGWDNSIFMTTLKKGRIYRQKLSADGNSAVGEPEELFYTQNRYRDVVFDPDGKTVYIITDSGGTTSGPSGSSSLTVTDLGKILVYTYNPALLACAAPVPDVTTLATITDNCPVTLTPPTATNNCSGTIVGTTTTTFPITATTTVIWTYSYGKTNSVTQNQIVTINSSNTTWDGIAWSNGTPDSTKGVIIAGNYTVASDLSACTLTVNNNAIVSVNTGVNLNISGDLTVATGSSLTFANNANLLQTKTTNGNTGNVTIKRQTSALKFLDYAMWSSPVASQQLQSFSPATLVTRFNTYNSSTDKYNAVASPSTTNFKNATGYLIRMPNNHPATATIWEGQFQGIPNNGDFSIAIAQNKYNAIGNPYPSTINADTFISVNGATEALYFWRKTNNAASTSYATYTTAGGTANAGGGSSIVPNGTIQVGQGFIYKSTAVALSFTNAMRTSNTANQFLKTKAKVAEEKSRIWLNLSKDTEPINQMMLAYMPGATSGIDPAIDGRYINDSPTSLNSLVENEEFVIQGRAPFDNTDIVPLAFKADTSGNFAIEIDHVDGLFSGSQDVILKDNLTGTETDLKTNPYTFTASAGTDNARFSLKYQKTLGIAAPEFNDNSVIIFKNNGIIHIKSEVDTIDSVQLFDIKGTLLFEKMKVNANETTIESSKFTNQVLIAKIASSKKKVVSKKIVN
jgi:PQQ-dependent dehydrogenase (s-GDH family)